METKTTEARKYYFLTSRLLIRSLVLKTFISSCFLKSLSLDQIPQLRYNASAKYGESLECGANFSAFDCISSGNSYIGKISTLSLSINKSLTLSLPMIAANKAVASTTSSIHSPLSLPATAIEILSVNFLAAESEILIFEDIILSLSNSFIVFSSSLGKDIVMVPILASQNDYHNNRNISTFA